MNTFVLRGNRKGHASQQPPAKGNIFTHTRGRSETGAGILSCPDCVIRLLASRSGHSASDIYRATWPSRVVLQYTCSQNIYGHAGVFFEVRGAEASGRALHVLGADRYPETGSCIVSVVFSSDLR